MGLNVDWGDRNLGVDVIGDGYYVSWGDVDYDGKRIFDKENYYSKNGGVYSPKDYNSMDDTILSRKKDIVSVVLNKGKEKGWRMPTREEMEELYNNCNWELRRDTDPPGYLATSKKNGCSIFFPLSGYRSNNAIVDEGQGALYWTSTVCADGSFMNAYALYLNLRSANISDFPRYLGLTIRPVREKQ